MRTMLWWMGLGLAACDGARMSGRVDGEPVGGARDAFFDTIEVELGPFDSIEYRVVVLTDFRDGCQVIEDVTDAIQGNCDDICDELVPVAEDHHLTDERYWTTTIVANVSDGVNGDFDYDDLPSGGEFDLTFSDWDASGLESVDACKDACDDGELLQAQSETGDDGSLELDESDDGEVLSGRFDVDLGGDDGLEGSFHAHACDLAQGWLLEF